MYNWSTDEEKFKKENPKEYRLWKLVQLINYGLDGKRLDREEIKKAWSKIKDQLDPDKRKTIEFYIWGKKWHREKGLHQDRKNFWQWYEKHLISLRNSI